MKAIVLDFDGVIFDTMDETLFLSFNIYKGVNPLSPVTISKIPNSYREKFYRFRYLVARPFQFSFLWSAIEKLPEDKIEFSFYKSLEKDKEGYGSFEDNFLNLRKRLMSDYIDIWLALCKPFTSVVTAIKEIGKEYPVYVSSTRDINSISFLFRYVGLSIKPEYIFGKENGNLKLDHIKAICQHGQYRFEDIVFIDDNLLNFKGISDLGIHCYLATWGYNHSKQTAKQLKFPYTAISQDEILLVLQ